VASLTRCSITVWESFKKISEIEFFFAKDAGTIIVDIFLAIDSTGSNCTQSNGTQSNGTQSNGTQSNGTQSNGGTDSQGSESSLTGTSVHEVDIKGTAKSHRVA